jgi:hypothetical protein
MRQRQRRQLGGTFVAFSVRTLMPGSRSAFGRDKGSAQTRPGGRSLTKGPLAHRLDRAGLSRVGLGVQTGSPERLSRCLNAAATRPWTFTCRTPFGPSLVNRACFSMKIRASRTAE